MLSKEQLTTLRTTIGEGLRVQQSGSDSITYVDVDGALADMQARQNHVVFARRGCGKTLLMHASAKALGPSTKRIYLNCEDFKHHSFPNVLIEIVTAVVRELGDSATGFCWTKRKFRNKATQICTSLLALRSKEDTIDAQVRQLGKEQSKDSLQIKTAGPVRFTGQLGNGSSSETELTYRLSHSKLRELDSLLPELKRDIAGFVSAANPTTAFLVQVDDFYHLSRADQPFVMDYLHRLCKDTPLFFKVATLKHASALFADRGGQPVGAQERHDYQPLNIDFTFSDFPRTREQNWRILVEFGRRAYVTESQLADLFKGTGFERLVLAGGGVPRDVLSLFLEVLKSVQSREGDPRIGKDDVRILSRANLERRIEELKADSEGEEQDSLIRGIYALRKFCLEKQNSAFLVSEQAMLQEDQLRELINRLLDYRIIHFASSALTHKTLQGTFQAYVIDIGCYAHMRKLDGRFVEIDVASKESRELLRSAPVLDLKLFGQTLSQAPDDTEAALLAAEEAG